MEYKDFFSPQTLEKLNKKSAENLKTMLGDKNLMQTMISSQQLLSQISKAEAPYKSQLEKLAVNMVKELYPIIDEEGIVLDAKIGDIGSVTSELDEIKINNPNQYKKYKEAAISVFKELADENKIEANKDYYNSIINFIKNANSETEINNTIWEKFFFEDDKEGFEEFKEEINFKLKDNLDEIRVNRPGVRLKLRKISKDYGKLYTKDNTWYNNWKDWNNGSDGIPVNIYKNYIYLTPFEEDKINEFKTLLNSKGISSQIVTWHDIPRLKISNQYYDLIDQNSNLDEIKVIKPTDFPFLRLKKGQKIKFETKDYSFIGTITDIKFINYKPEFNNDEELLSLDFDLTEDFLSSESMNVYIKRDLKNYTIKPGAPSYVTIPKKEIETYIFLNPKINPKNEKNIQANNLSLWNNFTILNSPPLTETISPESRRRIINAITQGAALRGAFAFYLFKEHLDEIDSSLVEKYNQIMKNSFGIYDDENAIAMMLSLLAQGQKMAGGSSKVIIKEQESGITIKARAINFPMLVHELIKGLYELISLQGFKGSKEERQAVVDKVDLLKNEPSDIRYGKFIFDALNEVFANSGYNDPRIREFFFAEVYQLNDDEFISFIENAVNEELTSTQQSWIKNTLRDIDADLRADDFDSTGIKEIKIEKPGGFFNKFGEIDAVENEFEGAMQTGDYTQEEYLEELIHISEENLEDLNGGYYEIAKILNNLKNSEKKIAIQNIKKWAQNTLKNPLNEIKINNPGQSILFGLDSNNKFTELIKIKGFKTLNKALDAIQKTLNPTSYNHEDLFHLDKQNPEDSASDMKYAYISGDGSVYFIKDLSEFDDGYNTEEEWGVVKWSKTLNEIKINNPSLSYEDILKYLKDYILNDKISNKSAKFYSILGKYGYRAGDKTKDFINKLSGPNRLLLKTDLENLKEIKVNNPYRKAKLTTGDEDEVIVLRANIPYETVKDKVDDDVYFFDGDRTEVTWNLIRFKDGEEHWWSSDELEFIKEIKVNNPSIVDLSVDGEEDTWIDTDKVKKYLLPKYPKEETRIEEYVEEINDGGDPNSYKNISIPELIKDFLQWMKDNDYQLNEIKINKSISSQKKIFESFDQKIISLITEYSEKTINTTIERWKKENPKTDENLAKQLIQRFDQIKSGLAQKLDIIVLPDALKQGNNYLNIDKYSYDDMIKLIKSLPENPEKVKKDAIERFVKNEQIDKATAQSYVSRFIANKDKLKYAVENGTEDESFTKEEVKELIPKNLLNNNAYLDPRVWKWQSFEQLIDALFPSQKKASEGEENLVSTDADKIYSGNGIEIYKGDDVHKCISYNPVIDKRKKYGWCVTQVGNTNYDYYRFGDKAPTFYFIFDRTRSSAPNHSPFDDQWHAFVIQVTADAKTYIITGADNRGDKPVDGWENVSKVVPPETWAKIKNLKDYFKPIALSAVERGRKFASGKDLSLDEFKELSQDEKILYVQGKASKNQISKNILKILPQYKINLEGRSTTLANVAIDSGQKFSYDDLKDNEPLAKRYAAFRFRHTNYGKEPIPLSFVKYLDEESKQKYLNTFDDNLTFEYIEKFFGDKVAEKYVEKQLKKLDYLPPSAVKYIKNPKLKQLFETYSKLFSSWQFSANTNISEKELENMATMPEQSVNPVPINQKQWSSFSNSERKAIIELAEKFNQDLKYATLLYALPYIIKDENMKYVLVPKSNQDFQYDSWVIMDEQGKVIKDNISGDSTLGNIPLYNGYPDESTDYNRIYNINDLKTNKK